MAPERTTGLAGRRRGRSPEVSAQFEYRDGARRITRVPAGEPTGPLPSVDLPVGTSAALHIWRELAHGSSAPRWPKTVVAQIAERRLAGARNEMLLIEEPELMLTPQQQRHFYRLLRRYSERNQVIYSTRAPAMLEAAHYPEIVRLDLSPSGMAVRRASRGLLTEEQRVRLEAEFDHERNEMFFATAVVLTEGQTERVSLPLIFRRLGHDPGRARHLDRRSWRQGQPGALLARANELRIPHVIVHDR